MKTLTPLVSLSAALLLGQSVLAQDTAETARTTAEEAVSAAKDQAVDAAKDKASDLIDQAKDKAADKAMDVAKDQAKDKAKSMASDLMDSAKDSARDKASELIDGAKDRAMDMARDKATELVGGDAASDAAGEADAAAAPGMDPAVAQAYEKMAEVRPEHERLKAFEGSWDTTVRIWMGPGDPDVSTGTSRNSLVLGGRYLQMEYSGSFMGQPFNGIGLTGYDNLAGSYTSLWIDDASTMMAVMQGQYDSGSNSWTYKGSMPDPVNPGRQYQVREVLRIESLDRHVLEWFETRGSDAEARTMEITYNRKR